MSIYKDFLLKERKKWLDENSFQSQLISNRLCSYNPIFGYTMKLDNIEVHSFIFREEYNIIRKAYNSIIDKLNDHWELWNHNGTRKNIFIQRKDGILDGIIILFKY